MTKKELINELVDIFNFLGEYQSIDLTGEPLKRNEIVYLTESKLANVIGILLEEVAKND